MLEWAVVLTARGHDGSGGDSNRGNLIKNSHQVLWHQCVRIGIRGVALPKLRATRASRAAAWWLPAHAADVIDVILMVQPYIYG